jgi:hypothetical protein
MSFLCLRVSAGVTNRTETLCCPVLENQELRKYEQHGLCLSGEDAKNLVKLHVDNLCVGRGLRSLESAMKVGYADDQDDAIGNF